ncbi:MAG: hydroxyisourate hydrolase [Verrucomicrobiota bacterium]
MAAKLTTHVLDTAHGKPAVGMRIQLFREETLLVDITTNADGRCDAPLLSSEEMFSGACRLVFHVGDYFRSLDVASPFLDRVSVEFLLNADQGYHVPLICTPWSYSTYRGS